jgi:hypothetical protein
MPVDRGANRNRSIQTPPEGGVVPGLYETVRQYHRHTLDRLDGDDVVYRYLKMVEGPTHRDLLQRMDEQGPVPLPARALTDFDDGVTGSELDWLLGYRSAGLLVWPDDRVELASTQGTGRGVLSDGFSPYGWQLCGHTPRWPLDK